MRNRQFGANIFEAPSGYKGQNPPPLRSTYSR